MSNIVKNYFFKGEIFLPQARPTITSDISDLDDFLLEMITEKEEECLSYCLGELYFDFKSNLDLSQSSGLAADADVKWYWLLNGRNEYLNSEGKKKSFKGIRFKSNNESDVYDKSFIAYYIYYYFRRATYISTTNLGDTMPKAKNGELLSPNIKTSNAWRKFYDLVVGKKIEPAIFYRKHGLGIDYYNPSNIFSSLYEFIDDMNKIEPETYPNFKKYKWININSVGL